MSKRRTLAERLAEIATPKPRDVDPEEADLSGFAPPVSNVDSGLYLDDEQPPRSLLRAAASLEEMGAAYAGRVVTREELDIPLPSSDLDDEELSEVTTSDSESDPEVPESDVGETAAAVAAERHDVEEQLRALEAEEQHLLARPASEDGEKAEHVQAQQRLWGSGLTLRIRLQQPIQLAARLPHPVDRPLFVSPSAVHGPALDALFDATAVSCEALLRDMLELDRAVAAQNQDVPAAGDLPPATADSGTKASDGKPASASKRKRRRADANERWWPLLNARWESCLPWYEQVIDKWNRKTQVTTGRAALTDKNFKALNQSVVSQIRNTMADEERLIRRTQQRRSDAPALGQRLRQSESAGVSDDAGVLDDPAQAGPELDVELFDDTDFYQQLLRDVVDGRVGGDATDVDLARAAHTAARRRVRKSVDRRASKGRKIRYAVMPKLVNFMAPLVKHDEAFLADELFRGLFA